MSIHILKEPIRWLRKAYWGLPVRFFFVSPISSIVHKHLHRDRDRMDPEDCASECLYEHVQTELVPLNPV